MGSSKIEKVWLRSLKIKGLVKQAELKGKSGATYFVDGYDSATNTVYELNGGFWHGDPKKYKAEDVNPKNGVKFGELYRRTLKREQDLLDAGYRLVVKWV
jgi:G:T-mismatch repair DNA endonuclease (very short patch repair protein)